MKLSIIIPAYGSHKTIAASVTSLLEQHSAPAHEIIVVDSSPDERTRVAVEHLLSHIRYEHVDTRLLPHAARNRGASLAKGDSLLFTDPDIIAPANWVEAMTAMQSEREGVVISAIACSGRRWLDRGIHFCKYGNWLPGGPVRRVTIGPTSGMLCTRAAFERVGRFQEEYMLADTLISEAFNAAEIPLWFMPEPAAEHAHTSSFSDFLRERRERGREYGMLRVLDAHWGPLRALAGVAVLPLRLLSQTARTGGHAVRNGSIGAFLNTLPVLASGHAAWLAGEGRAYLWRLLGLPQEGPCKY